MRPGTAGAGRALEWGQDTDQPGSRVRDVDGRPIFTGSKVELVANPAYRATVVLLDDETHIRYRPLPGIPPLLVPLRLAKHWRVVS